MLNVGDNVQIAGCSTKKRLLEASSGCDSFDTLLGGGIVNSSIVLIDEVRSRGYGHYLTRAFLAEGVHHGHRCLVADPVEDPTDKIINKIPSVKEKKDDVDDKSPLVPRMGEMKIAWRYEKTKQVTSSIGSSGGGNPNVYDFAHPLENPNVEVYNEEMFSFSRLYKRLLDIVQENEAHTKSTGRGGPKKNLLRVVLRNIDVEIWEDYESLGKFLCCLRSLARNSYMIVYLCVNSFAVPKDLWRTIETSVDTHIQLKAFDDQEKKTFRHLGSVQGYFYLKSLPRLLSVGTHTPPILDLIFEASSRKGFQIKVMHLPPALDDPSPSKAAAPDLSCQKIDF